MQDPAGIYENGAAAFGNGRASYDSRRNFKFALMTEQFIYTCEAIFSDGATPASSKRWDVSMQNYY